MPYLVVLGTGSWSSPGISRTTFKASECKRTGRAYEVEREVADAALATGYEWLMVFEDGFEPALDVSDPVGPLEPDDVRVGVSGAVRIKAPEDAEADEEEYEPEEAPEMTHGCLWCARRFPSSGALDRHVEFAHTHRHERDVAEAVAEYEAQRAERDAVRRLREAEEALPPWEREAGEVD